MTNLPEAFSVQMPVSATPTSTASAPRAPVSAAAVTSLVIASFVVFGHTTVKLIGSLIGNNWEWNQGPLPAVFGVIGVMSIFAIGIVIICGHIGVHSTRNGTKRGRAIATVGLTAGYLFLILYFNALLAAVIEVSFSNSWGYFFPMFFWVA